MGTVTVEEHSEVERKYDVAPDAELPDLGVLTGVASVAPPVHVEQTATYFDTSDLRLLAARVTLRRRTGGLDDGWHLKLPGEGDRRDEVRVPLGEAGETDQPPAELLDRVRGLVRGAPVAPSAVLVTRRSVHRLLGAGSTVLAELCDDRVSATVSGSSAGEQWREWELELVDGPEELLDEAEPLLCAAGATRSVSASKVGRVLAGRLPGRPTAGDLLVRYLAEHLAQLQRQDRLLRAGDPEGVHQLRVASRRLRSALATYAPILEPGATTGLRAELQWFGGVLSEARDAQVLGQRLVALAEQQPEGPLRGRAVDRIDDELRGRFDAGRVAAGEALDGARYVGLLDRLEAFVGDPPVVDAARTEARELVPGLVRAELTRLRRRDRAYRHATSRHDRDRALHEVRKSAKRLRYAAETARPVFGRRATLLAARAEALQELLGEHQDSVVGRATLREIGQQALDAGESSVTFERLRAIEAARAGDLEKQYADLLAALPRKDLRVWLRK